MVPGYVKTTQSVSTLPIYQDKGATPINKLLFHLAGNPA